MIVVLEGVDGGGKTTLADTLQSRLKMNYIHVTNPEPGENVFAHHFDPVRGVKDNTVVDRLHWSDDVYGAVLRGGPGLTDQEFGFIDGYLASRGGVLVLCLPPLATVLGNVAKAPGRKNHDDATAVRIWDEYQKQGRSFLTVLTYDYTTDPHAVRLVHDLALMAAHFAKNGNSSC
jgi:hypothetical protein